MSTQEPDDHDSGTRPAVSVRTATIADAHAIATVRVRTWREAYAGLIDQVVLDALDVDREAIRRTEQWDQRHTDPRGAELVAEVDGEVVGWAAFGPAQQEWRADDDDNPAGTDASTHSQLYAIYALPTHWSHGVGHALLTHAEERMRAIGARTAHLWVLDGNERAASFYERHGWIEDGATKDDDRLVGGAAAPLHERRRVKQLHAEP